MILPLPLAGEGWGEGGWRRLGQGFGLWPHPHPALSRQRERVLVRGGGSTTEKGLLDVGAAGEVLGGAVCGDLAGAQDPGLVADGERLGGVLLGEENSGTG